jgi:hypothetical protein
LWLAALVLLFAPLAVFAPAQTAAPESERLSAAEFGRLVQELSEPGGYFHSDNFTSNETSYLSILDKLQALGVSGGAYIGVGPEQNFTYIAKIRPRIAFIIDIRRQAVIQHLMYKALFHLAENRAEFLSLLLSRPLSGPAAPGPEAGVPELMEYFTATPAAAAAFDRNLERFSNLIRNDFHVPLSPQDEESLAYICRSFRDEGLGISFQLGRGGPFPRLRDLIEQPGSDGRPGNFLASERDYRFVRELQRRNRIIPVVGDFAGDKALKAIGDYLREEGYAVSAFYTSNVEQFLFRNDVFGAFAENVKALPVNAKSVFIRAVPNRGRSYAQFPPARLGVLVQPIAGFVADWNEAPYSDYWQLLSSSTAPDPR